MNQDMPNENEIKKLHNMVVSFKYAVVNIVILSVIYWLVRFFFNQYPVLQIVIYLTLLLAIFFLLIRMALLNKCPRCSRWGTPLMGGRCPKCGLSLPGLRDIDKY